MTDFVRGERSDSHKVVMLGELILRKPRLLHRSTLRTVRDLFSETNLVSSSPVIRLTALPAMLISRDCRFGQENARHASIVASTSLYQMSKGT